MDSFVELSNFLGCELFDVKRFHVVDSAGFLEGGSPARLLDELQQGLECVHTRGTVQITFT